MRADVYLSSHGFARSREFAKKLIESGKVTFDGKTISKPSEYVDADTEHGVDIAETDGFVSRGGLKLEAALDRYGIDVRGLCAVDIGASTGGFTDCLLRRGARFVYAVDSGHGQLDPVLAADERVINIEGFNARCLCEGGNDKIKCDCDIAVMDVSFISQTYILPGIPNVLKNGGILISLIKPQFEAGRSAVGKGGIVRKKSDRLSAVRKVLDCAEDCNFGFSGLIKSPIQGGDGNTEYLAVLISGGNGSYPSVGQIEKMI